MGTEVNIMMLRRRDTRSGEEVMQDFKCNITTNRITPPTYTWQTGEPIRSKGPRGYRTRGWEEWDTNDLL